MDLPIYVYLIFGLIVLSAMLQFYKASSFSSSFLKLIIGWSILQIIISLLGFYKVADTFPPRFSLLIIPPLILTIISFNTKKGKRFIDSLNIKTLTLLHTIRIPVELVLYWLFVHKAVPGLMTFEGRNFDVFSGLSAPFIYYFGFVKKILNRKIILLWNFVCLTLLFNIIFNAALSLPGIFQQFAFDQPNIAILHFPFVLLPSVLVPLVWFSHFASIRQLLYSKNI
jgi:hypothetical protein